ncbi:hypothetical protein [Leptobacterium sp. I13]|uniref:hypothetical protein n=1 Tax=Leptobacterium meishanense TaxID=3128904 RepID=UPI0030EBB465
MAQPYQREKKLIWEENFENNSNDWDIGEHEKIANGKYYLEYFHEDDSYLLGTRFNINHTSFDPNEDFEIVIEYRMLKTTDKTMLALGLEYIEYYDGSWSPMYDKIMFDYSGNVKAKTRHVYDPVHLGKPEKYYIDGINKMVLHYQKGKIFIFVNQKLFRILDNVKALDSDYDNWNILFEVQNARVSINNVKIYGW